MKLPEPVAWINPHKPSEVYTDDELDPMWKHWDMTPLYTADQLREARRAALEEAAKVCEIHEAIYNRNMHEAADDSEHLLWKHAMGAANDCFDAIRALIEESGND